MAARNPIVDKFLYDRFVESVPFLRALRDDPIGAPSGMGEQPSIINRDPGDESRALVLPPPSKTLLELIQGLEAAVASIRADLDRLMAAPPAPSAAPTPPPHNPMANALAHSEPKPAWQR